MKVLFILLYLTAAFATCPSYQEEMRVHVNYPFYQKDDLWGIYEYGNHYKKVSLTKDKSMVSSVPYYSSCFELNKNYEVVINTRSILLYFMNPQFNISIVYSGIPVFTKSLLSSDMEQSETNLMFNINIESSNLIAPTSLWTYSIGKDIHEENTDSWVETQWNTIISPSEVLHLKKVIHISQNTYDSFSLVCKTSLTSKIYVDSNLFLETTSNNDDSIVNYSVHFPIQSVFTNNTTDNTNSFILSIEIQPGQNDINKQLLSDLYQLILIGQQKPVQEIPKILLPFEFNLNSQKESKMIEQVYTYNNNYFIPNTMILSFQPSIIKSSLSFVKYSLFISHNKNDWIFIDEYLVHNITKDIIYQPISLSMTPFQQIKVIFNINEKNAIIPMDISFSLYDSSSLLNTISSTSTEINPSTSTSPSLLNMTPNISGRRLFLYEGNIEWIHCPLQSQDYSTSSHDNLQISDDEFYLPGYQFQFCEDSYLLQTSVYSVYIYNETAITIDSSVDIVRITISNVNIESLLINHVFITSKLLGNDNYLVFDIPSFKIKNRKIENIMVVTKGSRIDTQIQQQIEFIYNDFNIYENELKSLLYSSTLSGSSYSSPSTYNTSLILDNDISTYISFGNTVTDDQISFIFSLPQHITWFTDICIVSTIYPSIAPPEYYEFYGYDEKEDLYMPLFTPEIQQWNTTRMPTKKCTRLTLNNRAYSKYKITFFLEPSIYTEQGFSEIFFTTIDRHEIIPEYSLNYHSALTEIFKETWSTRFYPIGKYTNYRNDLTPRSFFSLNETDGSFITNFETNESFYVIISGTSPDGAIDYAYIFFHKYTCPYHLMFYQIDSEYDIIEGIAEGYDPYIGSFDPVLYKYDHSLYYSCEPIPEYSYICSFHHNMSPITTIDYIKFWHVLMPDKHYESYKNENNCFYKPQYTSPYPNGDKHEEDNRIEYYYSSTPITPPINSWRVSNIQDLPYLSRYQYYRFTLHQIGDCYPFPNCKPNPFTIKVYSYGRYKFYINGQLEYETLFIRDPTDPNKRNANLYTDENNVFSFTHVEVPFYKWYFNTYLTVYIEYEQMDYIPFHFLVELMSDSVFKERSNYYFYDYTTVPTTKGLVPRTSGSKYIPDATTPCNMIISRYEFYNWAISPRSLLVSIPFVQTGKDTHIILSGYDESSQTMVPIYSFMPYGVYEISTLISKHYSIFELSSVNPICSPNEYPNNMDNKKYMSFNHAEDHVLGLGYLNSCIHEIKNIKGAELNVKLCELYDFIMIDIYPPLPSSMHLDHYTGYLSGSYPQTVMTQEYTITLTVYSSGLDVLMTEFTITTLNSDITNTMYLEMNLPYFSGSCSIEVVDQNQYDQHQILYSNFTTSRKQYKLYRRTDLLYVNVICSSITSFKEATYYIKPYNGHFLQYDFFDDSKLTQSFELSTYTIINNRALYASRYTDKEMDIQKDFVSEYYSSGTSTTKKTTTKTAFINYSFTYTPSSDRKGLIELFIYIYKDVAVYVDNKFLIYRPLGTPYIDPTVTFPVSFFSSTSNVHTLQIKIRESTDKQTYVAYMWQLSSDIHRYIGNTWTSSLPDLSSTSLNLLGGKDLWSTTISTSSCKDIELYRIHGNGEKNTFNQYTVYSPSTCKQYMPTSWEIYGVEDDDTQVLLDRVHNQFWVQEGNEKKTFSFFNELPYKKYIMKIKLCLNTNYPSTSQCPYVSTPSSFPSLNNTLLPHVLFGYKYISTSLCTISSLDYNLYRNSYYYQSCKEGYEGYKKYSCSSQLTLVEDQCIYLQKPIFTISPPVYYKNETSINIQVIQSSDKQIKYSITPELPEGITLNINTGLISGIPLAIPENTLYTITATTLYGSSSQYIVLNIVEREEEENINLLRRLVDIENNQNHDYVEQYNHILMEEHSSICKGTLYYNKKRNQCDICINGILIQDKNEFSNIGCKQCSFGEYSDGQQCIKKKYCKQMKEWPKTLVNTIAYLSCGNKTHEGYRTRKCLEGGIWDNVDDNQCIHINNPKGGVHIIETIHYNSIPYYVLSSFNVENYKKTITEIVSKHTSSIHIYPYINQYNSSYPSFTVQISLYTNMNNKNSVLQLLNTKDSVILESLKESNNRVFNPFVTKDYEYIINSDSTSLKCINPETNDSFEYGTYSSLYNTNKSLCNSLLNEKVQFKNYYCDQNGLVMEATESDPILCKSLPQLSSSSYGYYTIHIENIPFTIENTLIKQLIYNKSSSLPNSSPHIISSSIMTRYQLLEDNDSKYILEIDIQYTSSSLSDNMKSFLNSLLTSKDYIINSLEDLLNTQSIQISILNHTIHIDNNHERNNINKPETKTNLRHSS
ncbi:hypothetical protein WA158_008416 [Blastocystis sp. Blastoise]